MLNKRSRTFALLAQLLVVLQVLLPMPTMAAISNLPPLVKANVPPNVFYTLDDSGSMMFEVMPDNVTPTGNAATDGTRKDNVTYCPSGGCWVVRVFPAPKDVYNVSGAGNYGAANETVVGFSDNITVARWRSSEVNSIYYDPKIRYDPWIDPASISITNPYGSPMPKANKNAAKYNPVIISGMTTATIDLEKEQLNTLHDNQWLNDAANGITKTPTWTVNGVSKTKFYPATYFQYNPDNLSSCTTSTYSCFKRIEIKSTTVLPKKATTRSDCSGLDQCTYEEEITNFANWFQYYRSRILTARAGSGSAFAKQSPSLRVGFGTINEPGTKVTNVSDDFNVANKKLFLETLYQRKIPAAGTPLRKAVDDVGQYFMNKTITGPWQTKYNTGLESQQLSCRQNYNILMTDGYWNGAAAGSGRTGDWDAKDGSLRTNWNGTETFQYKALPPYKDTNPDTLADIAMYYWVNDLRPDWPQAKKNVPIPKDKSDPGFWQHLVQYTVGFGVKGTLDPKTDLPALTAGTKSWPVAATNQIDDLWHAALNSRGKYFNAGNPKEFAESMDSALNEIAARSGDAAAVATSKNTLDVGLKLYTSTYQTEDWSGRLEQKSVHPVTGKVANTNDWDTNGKIPKSDSRKIYTVAAANGKQGTEFKLSNLDSSHQSILTTAAAAYAPSHNVSATNIVDYIRGDQTLEGKPFRARKVLLGDLVNSDPQYVKEGKDGGYTFLPSDIVGKSQYASFLKRNASRAATVYVGSNDGMLHAFDATESSSGGSERFAFIPKAVVPNLHELAKPNYVHRFYVDGTPSIGDAAIGSNPLDPWKTILVGTTGAGGRSVFALDITDPTAFDATKILWERNSTTPVVDADLGFTIGVAQIGVMQNGRWVAVFGNGFESANQKAVLYIVDLKDGEIIKKLDTGVGGSGAPNGLSTPKLALNADSTIAAVYAGDRQGNMWKFDFITTGTSPNKVTVQNLALSGQPLFKAIDSSRNQPITTQPQLFEHPEGGNVVVFGTGKIYEDTDAATTDKETLYGIWDKTPSTVVTRSQLIEQTLTESGDYYKVSKNVVDWSSKRGWFITMNIKNGERIVTDPILFEDQVIFTTLIPGNNADLCVIDALSTTLQISPLNGAALGYKTLDTSGDGKITSADLSVSGRRSTATFGTTIIRLGNRKIKIVQADAKTGSLPKEEDCAPTDLACIARGGKGDTSLSAIIPTVRLWRQLIGRQ